MDRYCKALYSDTANFAILLNSRQFSKEGDEEGRKREREREVERRGGGYKERGKGKRRIKNPSLTRSRKRGFANYPGFLLALGP